MAAPLPRRGVRHPRRTPPAHAFQHDPQLDRLDDRRRVLRCLRPPRHHDMGRLLAQLAPQPAARPGGLPAERRGEDQAAAQPSFDRRLVRRQRRRTAGPARRLAARRRRPLRRRRPPLPVHIQCAGTFGKRAVGQFPPRLVLRCLPDALRLQRPPGMGFPHRNRHGGIHDIREFPQIHARRVVVAPQRHVGQTFLRQVGGQRRPGQIFRDRGRKLRRGRRDRGFLPQGAAAQPRGQQSHVRGLAASHVGRRHGHHDLDEPAGLPVARMADLRLLPRPDGCLLGHTQGVRTGAYPVEPCRQFGQGSQYDARTARSDGHGTGLRPRRAAPAAIHAAAQGLARGQYDPQPVRPEFFGGQPGPQPARESILLIARRRRCRGSHRRQRFEPLGERVQRRPVDRGRPGRAPRLHRSRAPLGGRPRRSLQTATLGRRPHVARRL